MSERSVNENRSMSVFARCWAINENYGDGWQKSNLLTKYLVIKIRKGEVPHTEIIEETCIYCEED